MVEGLVLRLEDQRRVKTLAGECCELGRDPYSWHFHLFEGLRSLVGFQVATAGMSDAPLEALSIDKFRGVVDEGWSHPDHRACAQPSG